MELAGRGRMRLQRFFIQDGLKISRSVQHLDDPDGGIFRRESIEDHVFWKAGNEYPAQSAESRRTKTARGTAHGQIQQGLCGLIDSLFPSLSQSRVRGYCVIVRLLDDGPRGRLGDAQFDHRRASFSRRTETRVR